MSFEASGYKPSKWGQLYHNAVDSRGKPIDELLGGGAAGGGKTRVLLMDPLPQIVLEHKRAFDRSVPDAHRIEVGKSVGWALHIRRTTSMLEQTIRDALRIFPQIDPPDAKGNGGFKWNENKTTGKFSSGFTFQFGHCAESGDWERYQGLELTHFAADELTQFESEQIDQISTRVRTSDKLLAPYLRKRYMSNPVMQRTGETFSFKGDPTWVRKRFVDPAPAGKEVLRQVFKLRDGTEESVTRMYLPARLSDNPNPEFARRYEIELQSKKPHIRRALLEGDWYIVEGSYFADVWDPTFHIVKPFDIPDHWPQWRSMDWGFKTPGCVGWYAMDDDGNVCKTRELTFINKSDQEVADIVRDLETRMGLWDKRNNRSRITGPADTQLWEKRGDAGVTKAEVFAQKGINWIPADKKNRATNAMHVYKRLEDRRGGTPGFYIFNTCIKTIQTLPLILTEPDTDVPQDGGDDHWYDETSYSMAFVSQGRSVIPKMTPKWHPDDRFDRDPPPPPETGSGGPGYGISY
jgi:hypothetical protein